MTAPKYNIQRPSKDMLPEGLSTEELISLCCKKYSIEGLQMEGKHVVVAFTDKNREDGFVQIEDGTNFNALLKRIYETEFQF